MECSQPPPLADENLFELLDGVADAQVEAHIAACPACAARFAALAQREATLMTRLNRFDCPPPQRLADVQLGIATQTAAAAVQAHLESCPRCREEWDALAAFLQVEDEQPQGARIIRPPHSVWEARRSDERGLAQARGLGGATFDAQASTAKLLLESERRGEARVLKGQIIDTETDWAGALAELWAGDTLHAVKMLDEMGEFQFVVTTGVSLDLYVTAASGVTIAERSLTL